MSHPSSGHGDTVGTGDGVGVGVSVTVGSSVGVTGLSVGVTVVVTGVSVALFFVFFSSFPHAQSDASIAQRSNMLSNLLPLLKAFSPFFLPALRAFSTNKPSKSLSFY